MASTHEYALMAGAAYISTRDDINKIPVPLGWEEVLGSYANLTSSGFEAISFRRGNEIVISFAGTDFTSISDWLNGNIPLVTGLPSEGNKRVRS
ncbi:MAG: hypothetical protein NUV55_01080 [Sulfuricaulis sp.]|uniref:hypothetical protein n=1 Tax=Sulfuricaulis sp. TaxID=2003553 RepID=UPI0025F88D0A|nr:hypothetical protein [Sulfuricaulis sp.]MCR4345789.1 hypothetical protein [Sulfuricaulis sp.]